MAKWQRFADDIWINMDHLEVVRVDEQDEGGWQLTATFASGRTYPIGTHHDRQLLADCTDAVLRGEVGERLLELADLPGDASVTASAESAEPSPKERWWRWPKRPATAVTSGAAEGLPQSDPLPAR